MYFNSYGHCCVKQNTLACYANGFLSGISRSKLVLGPIFKLNLFDFAFRTGQIGKVDQVSISWLANNSLKNTPSVYTSEVSELIDDTRTLDFCILTAGCVLFHSECVIITITAPVVYRLWPATVRVKLSFVKESGHPYSFSKSDISSAGGNSRLGPVAERINCT